MRDQAQLAAHGYRTSPAAALAALRRGLRLARDVLPPVERTVAVAGVTIRLRCRGDLLAGEILAPFAHLPAARGNGAPDLAAELWSADETGVEAPVGPGPPPASALGIVVADGPGQRLLHDWRPHADLVLDRGAGRIVGRLGGAGRLASSDLARPLQRLLAPPLLDRGLVAAHAAVVGEDGRAVLLAGPSGAGKSTTALACLGAGLDYLGDDTVMLGMAEGRVTAHSLYSTCVVRPGPATLRGPLARCPVRRAAGEPKAVFRLHGAAAGLPRSARVVAALLPAVDPGGATRLGPAGPGAFLRAGMGQALLIGGGAGLAAVEALARIAASLPVHRLRLGRDPGEIVEAIRRVLRDPGAPAARS